MSVQTRQVDTSSKQKAVKILVRRGRGPVKVEVVPAKSLGPS